MTIGDRLRNDDTRQDAIVEVADAVLYYAGNRAHAAEALGYSRESMFRWLRTYPALKAAVDAAAGKERTLEELLLLVPPNKVLACWLDHLPDNSRAWHASLAFYDGEMVETATGPDQVSAIRALLKTLQ